MKKFAYLAIFLAFMSTVHASAQEAGQTKVNAIKFLDITLPGSKFEYEKDPYWRKMGDVIRDAQEYSNECKFKYTVHFPYSEYKHSNGSGNYFNEFTAKNWIGFDQVSEIKRNVGKVSIYYIGDSKLDTTHFLFSSEQAAIRVAYAMEFLRQQCDAAAGTGF